MREAELIKEICACGAHRAETVPDGRVVLSADFRDICAANQCGKYDRCWVCPPAVGEIDALMRDIGRFSHAVLFQTVYPIEDSFDIEGMERAVRRHTAVTQRVKRRVQTMSLGEYLLLSCGGCTLCKACTKPSGQPCRHPDLTVAPMEAYGIDVYRTACRTALPYINGKNTVTYFGILLWRE